MMLKIVRDFLARLRGGAAAGAPRGSCLGIVMTGTLPLRIDGALMSKLVWRRIVFKMPMSLPENIAF